MLPRATAVVFSLLLGALAPDLALAQAAPSRSDAILKGLAPRAERLRSDMKRAYQDYARALDASEPRRALSDSVERLAVLDVRARDLLADMESTRSRWAGSPSALRDAKLAAALDKIGAEIPRAATEERDFDFELRSFRSYLQRTRDDGRALLKNASRFKEQIKLPFQELRTRTETLGGAFADLSAEREEQAKTLLAAQRRAEAQSVPRASLSSVQRTDFNRARDLARSGDARGARALLGRAMDGSAAARPDWEPGPRAAPLGSSSSEGEAAQSAFERRLAASKAPPPPAAPGRGPGWSERLKADGSARVREAVTTPDDGTLSTWAAKKGKMLAGTGEILGGKLLDRRTYSDLAESAADVKSYPHYGRVLVRGVYEDFKGAYEDGKTALSDPSKVHFAEAGSSIVLAGTNLVGFGAGGAAKEVGEQVVKTAAEQAAKDAAEQAAKGAAEQTAKDAAAQAFKDTAKEAGERSAKSAAREVEADVDQLSKAAAEPDRNGRSMAGRALEKHGGRPDSAFTKPVGPPSAKNRLGQEVVDEILTNPGTKFTARQTGRFGEVIEAVAPDGRGVRYTKDGKFIGFLEP